MKKIITILILGVLTLSCCKEQQPEYQPITWKTGILNNQVENYGTLLISFSNSNYQIEEITFESVWQYTLQGVTYEVKLNQTDFTWTRERGALEGKHNIKFPSAPSKVHISLLIGRGKINGSWHGIKRYQN